jgi:hypothetical protein
MKPSFLKELPEEALIVVKKQPDVLDLVLEHGDSLRQFF